MRLRHAPRFAAVCLIAWSVAPASSSASDSKIFAASFCRVIPTANAPGTNALYHGAEIQNHDSLPMNVVCPVIRDNTGNGSGWDQVTVGLFDRNPESNIDCHAFSRTPDGIVLFDGAFGSVGSWVFKWKSIAGPDAPNSVPFGYYHINCRIPPLVVCQGPCACENDQCVSGLGFYRVQEP